MPDALDLLHQDHQAVTELSTAMGRTAADRAKRCEPAKEVEEHAAALDRARDAGRPGT